MFNEIISLENLCTAWGEFLRGKRGKPDVQAFGRNLADNLLDLHLDLSRKEYSHGSYHRFNISDPKPRIVHKASVRDRLLHHAVHRVLYPHFDRRFIADSYSCRTGKGTHAAMNRFRALAYQESRNHTRTVWILKCDIRKFFASIDHDILLIILRRHLSDEGALWLLGSVICSFSSGEPGKGLPLGNLTSQLLANIYLNELDQFVKHYLGVKHYIRYADDFVLLSCNRQILLALLPSIRRFLSDKLRLNLHDGKIDVSTLASGVDFLGWIHFPDHRIPRTKTRKRMLQRLRNDASPEALSSYLGLLGHGNTYRLKRDAMNAAWLWHDVDF